MLRVGQSARLLARLQSVADAIEGSQQPCFIISDALRLAARSLTVQAAPRGGTHHKLGHSGSQCSHVATSGVPARSFASETGNDQTKDESKDQPSHYECLEAMYRMANRDPLTGFIGRCGAPTFPYSLRAFSMPCTYCLGVPTCLAAADPSFHVVRAEALGKTKDSNYCTTYIGAALPPLSNYCTTYAIGLADLSDKARRDAPRVRLAALKLHQIKAFIVDCRRPNLWSSPCAAITCLPIGLSTRW